MEPFHHSFNAMHCHRCGKFLYWERDGVMVHIICPTCAENPPLRGRAYPQISRMIGVIKKLSTLFSKP